MADVAWIRIISLSKEKLVEEAIISELHSQRPPMDAYEGAKPRSHTHQTLVCWECPLALAHEYGLNDSVNMERPKCMAVLLSNMNIAFQSSGGKRWSV